HKIALRTINLDNDQREEHSYSDLINHSHRIASFLKDRGLEKGDPVALMLGQNPAWWFSLLGLMRGGFPVVPCPRLLTSQDLEYRINDLGIKAIITAPELQERVDAIKKECPSLLSLITTGAGNAYWDSFTDILNDKLDCVEARTTTADPCV